MIDDTEEIDRDRIALSGHEEARQRLLDIGRSDQWVDQLEESTDGFYQFAAATADSVKHHRRHHDPRDLTDD